ncbi:MAG: hypothetical protein MJY82_05905 [Fibrobacter sp.]|nr:hypothetical protein [Fibrobacter sp.]
MNMFVKSLITLFALLCVGCTTDADGDDFDAGKVCPVEGVNVYGMPNRGTFIDERDGREYKYTTIGNRMWMAENLNYDCDYGYCYEVDSIPNFCETYGRMYNLYKEGKHDGLLDWDKVDSICPKGWHVPTQEEWAEMVDLLGAGSTRFFDVSFNPQLFTSDDVCSLSVLSAGVVYYNFRLERLHHSAAFWTSTQRNVSCAYSANFTDPRGGGAYFFSALPRQSIRCIKDN